MRVFTATLGTETNSFSPIPTGMAGFRDCMLWRPGEYPDFATEATGPLWVGRERARQRGWTVTEGTCAFAMPAGPVSKPVYEALRDEILAQLEQALPVDFVALGLHGAMIAHGYPDCEGDLLRRVRKLVSADTAVGAELDCHCHLTPEMVRHADALVLFKEYPHTDYVERAEDLYDLLEATARRRVRPVMSVFDCRMIQGFRTRNEPAKGLVEKMRRLEGKNNVLSVSLAHGFSSGDVHDIGTKVLVITDDAESTGDKIAQQLGEDIYRNFRSLPAANIALETCMREALASDSSPVLLADTSDNAGGGMPGDRTQVIRALQDLGIGDACLGPLWDPVAVRFCHEAGAGATIDLRFGGKTAELSGDPIDACVKVVGLKKGATQNLTGATVPLGDTAGISFDGISVVLASLRDQAYSPNLFTDVGIDPAGHKLIIVKGTEMFTVGFEQVASEIIYLDYGVPVKERPFRNIRRPLWPLDANPLGLDGETP